MKKKKLNSHIQAPLDKPTIVEFNKNRELPENVKLNESLNLTIEENVAEGLVAQLGKLSQSYNDLINSSIAKKLLIANLCINLSKNVFNHFLQSMANIAQQNVVFTSSLVQCKDVNDLAALRQRMIETYYFNLMSFYKENGS